MTPHNLGVRDGDMVWVEGPEGGKESPSNVNRACWRGVAFMPFHFGGMLQGEDLRAKYPDGADPRAWRVCKHSTTYGYDRDPNAGNQVYVMSNHASVRRINYVIRWKGESQSSYVTPSAALNATLV